MYSCSLWTSHSCWKWIKYFYGVSQERGFMAPRISSLFCLIIIASVIDCRAGECLFGCFLRVPLAVCRRKTALHPSRTEMFLVGQPIMADPPPHPPLLFPLREWGPSPFMICPFLCPFFCHPVIPTHSISDSKRRMVKSFVKWLFWPETRVCAWPYDVDFPWTSASESDCYVLDFFFYSFTAK